MLTRENMKVGGRYNWKNQPERLKYIGMCEPRNGRWHQFEKVDEPGIVWCEVLTADLHMLEETPAAGVPESDSIGRDGGAAAWEVRVYYSRGERTLRAGMKWRDGLHGSTWEVVEPEGGSIYSPSGLGGTPTFWCKPADERAEKLWRQDARADGCVSFCGDSIAAGLIDSPLPAAAPKSGETPDQRPADGDGVICSVGTEPRCINRLSGGCKPGECKLHQPYRPHDEKQPGETPMDRKPDGDA